MVDVNCSKKCEHFAFLSPIHQPFLSTFINLFYQPFLSTFINYYHENRCVSAYSIDPLLLSAPKTDLIAWMHWPEVSKKVLIQILKCLPKPSARI
jgi:hypothetical protein